MSRVSSVLFLSLIFPLLLQAFVAREKDENDRRFDTMKEVDAEAERIKKEGGQCKEERAPIGLMTFPYYRCYDKKGVEVTVSSPKLLNEKLAELRKKGGGH
ncbi:MAG: hypothetical protein R3A80_13565 [Bdellovibrionota bacterium]